ncbi:hypothetical protein [Streptomyces sp. NPDC005322]|uniref:hypothetical protein n=1 Tax=Streptomyces sp. NPDC005322 TaxID=3157032 RepID=UPI00339DB1ED
MMAPGSGRDTNDGDTDEAWRVALGHIAGCPRCREPAGGCETGRALLRAYRRARRDSRRGRAGSVG